MRKHIEAVLFDCLPYLLGMSLDRKTGLDYMLRLCLSLLELLALIVRIGLILETFRTIPLAVVKIGLDIARAEYAHRDIGSDSLQLVVDTLGKSHSGMLGSIIRNHSDPVDDAGDRACVHNVAMCALLDHDRDDLSHEIHVRHKVGLDDPLPVAKRQVIAVARYCNARIIHKNIDCAILLKRRIYDFFRLLVNSHIGSNECDIFCSALLCDIFQLSKLVSHDVNRYDLHTPHCSLLDEFFAEAICCTGY